MSQFLRDGPSSMADQITTWLQYNHPPRAQLRPASHRQARRSRQRPLLAHRKHPHISLLSSPLKLTNISHQYFVLSGLKTNLGLLDNGITWGYSIAIILVAFFGKFLGCAIAAYAMKFSKRESLAVGTLMSCKGLVELIGMSEHIKWITLPEADLKTYSLERRFGCR